MLGKTVFCVHEILKRHSGSRTLNNNNNKTKNINKETNKNLSVLFAYNSHIMRFKWEWATKFGYPNGIVFSHSFAGDLTCLNLWKYRSPAGPELVILWSLSACLRLREVFLKSFSYSTTVLILTKCMLKLNLQCDAVW